MTQPLPIIVRKITFKGLWSSQIGIKHFPHTPFSSSEIVADDFGKGM